jgi:segregation and condensation protein B
MADASLSSPVVVPEDIVEAMLFASDGPLEPERIREVLGLADVAEAHTFVAALRQRYDESSRALAIAEVAGGYRMVTRPAMATWLVRLARAKTKQRLSRAALEALAIVGYQQPVSRPEIDAIRGVNSEGVLDSLLERGLVRIAGRKDAPGRPFLYETTREFLIAFGLRDLADLPKVEGELKVPVVDGAAGNGTEVTTGEEAAMRAEAGTADGDSESAVEPRGQSEILDGLAETTADAPTASATALGDVADAVAVSPAEEPAGQAESRERSESAKVDSVEGPAQQDPGAGGSHIAPGR